MKKLDMIADNQYLGQGTHDRKWYTGNSKNIAMSFVLLPECEISKITNITVLLAECIVDTIKNLYDIDLDIKEPNDIYYNGKKIGGILTETNCKGEIVSKIYIGIGINVNQDEFPEDLKEIATSLKCEFDKEFSREEIIVNFLNNFEKLYLKIKK